MDLRFISLGQYLTDDSFIKDNLLFDNKRILKLIKDMNIVGFQEEMKLFRKS